MSSFFTLPASQRKRKRADAPAPTKPRGRPAAKPQTNGNTEPPKRRKRDESISGSSTSSASAGGDSDADGLSSGSDEEHADETGAERRLRLAERYLQNIKDEVQQAHGFDAEEIDRELIAARLREDVAESKGKLYRFVARSYAYDRATAAHFRGATDAVTAVAACPPYVYTASKDRSLTKWKLADPPRYHRPSKTPGGGPVRQRPTKLLSRSGDHRRAGDAAYQGHAGAILCVAATVDGRFVATGGADRRLVVWSADKLEPLRVFSQHRDAVCALALQLGGPNRLYSASADRTIKTWGLDELAYIETLFGHQDRVADVAALSAERCLSAGARDRSVRLWKVVDETQLVFRGGGASKVRDGDQEHVYAEGSVDRVALIDDETFVTGSDSGALCLWSTTKKKPVFTMPLAHGVDPPPRLDEAYAEKDLSGKKVDAPPRPRWITALRAIPFSDLLVSGSWDGSLRVWRVTEDKRRIEAVAAVGGATGAPGEKAAANGVVNDLQIIEHGKKGQDGLCIVAALGREHRLGRWSVKGDAKNGAIVVEIPPHARRRRGTGA